MENMSDRKSERRATAEVCFKKKINKRDDFVFVSGNTVIPAVVLVSATTTGKQLLDSIVTSALHRV